MINRLYIFSLYFKIQNKVRQTNKLTDDGDVEINAPDTA